MKRKNKLLTFFDINYWFYDFVRITGLPLLLLFRFKFIFLDKEHKKEIINDPVFFIGVHHSMYDPILMEAALFFKRVSIIASKEIYEKSKFMNIFLKLSKAIKINKENVSLTTFKEVNKTIKNNHSVGIYPEGGINDKKDSVNDFKSGIILMSNKAKAPIYPIVIIKPKNIFHRTKVIFGKKFDFTNIEKINKKTLAEKAKILHDYQEELEKKYSNI